MGPDVPLLRHRRIGEYGTSVPALSIAGAGQNIRMENAYFVPDTLTRRRLIEARERGVSIQIIVPGQHMDEQVVRARFPRITGANFSPPASKSTNSSPP